ncbi:uncharacterized protein LOC133889146 [Phragmites australis]|uniref:uncharacterized protein LOC133889146 n=1 Tax=Phragmites australis TaxID=29695 RepID=UPI002D7884F3|nr:uncharacterized protein LOC133889146 [Phragmites australis]
MARADLEGEFGSFPLNLNQAQVISNLSRTWKWILQSVVSLLPGWSHRDEEKTLGCFKGRGRRLMPSLLLLDSWNGQFAVVENPGFWNWTFTLIDEDDNVLAQIDRNWRGIGFELFTDAGQYAIRFGDEGQSRKFGVATDIEEVHVVRQLTLLERAVALALAVSLDSDYFSRRGGCSCCFQGTFVSHCHRVMTYMNRHHPCSCISFATYTKNISCISLLIPEEA